MTDVEATPDVSVSDDDELSNPRLELMERMREKRNAEFTPTEGNDDPATVPVEEDDDPPPLAAEAEPADPEPPVYQRDGKWYAKRKVNGQEEEIAYDRLLMDSQKNAAADARLEQAAAERKRLEAYQAQLQAQAQELERARQQGQTAEQQTELDDLIKERHDAMLAYADDEEDAEAFKRLRDAEIKMQKLEADRAPQQPMIDEDEIVNKAMGRMKQQSWRQNYEKANSWLYNEQNELDMEDEHLHELASSEAKRILNERVEAGKAADPSFSMYDIDPNQVYMDAVSKTKDWLNAKAGNATTKARIDRKRSTTGRSVTGTQARAPLADKAPRIKTQSERIADMREARGLPT